jgi:hypothetical protein
VVWIYERDWTEEAKTFSFYQGLGGKADVEKEGFPLSDKYSTYNLSQAGSRSFAFRNKYGRLEGISRYDPSHQLRGGPNLFRRLAG